MSTTRLAALGGEAEFASPVAVGVPNIGDRRRLHQLIDSVLDSRRLSNFGPLAAEFEQRIADLHGVRHCLAVCNATTGLQLAVRAAGLTGEVVVPSFTFPATPHAIRWLGLTPMFCDVDRTTGNLDPRALSSVLTSRTSGVLAVHLWGRAADVDALTAVCSEHDLRLLFDSAHALGCSSGGRMIGGFGSAEVISFHATKFITSFEGGALLTNDDELAARARTMANFGISGPTDVAMPGTNAKMHEVSAAMGLVALDAMPTVVAHNRENYQAYRAGLDELPGMTVQPFDEREHNNYQYVVLDVDAEAAGLSRDALGATLEAENVLGRSYFAPGCHRTTAYRGVHAPQPGTEHLSDRLLVLPTGTAVTPDHISRICALTRLAVQHGRQLGELMTTSTKGTEHAQPTGEHPDPQHRSHRVAAGHHR